MKQPEAILLAEAMSLAFPGNKGIDKAAAELRRLHEANQAMLEVLKAVLKIDRGTSGRIIIEGWQEDAIRAAIAKGEQQ